MRKSELKKMVFARFEERLQDVQAVLGDLRAEVASFVAARQRVVDEQVAELATVFGDDVTDLIGDVSVVTPNLSGKREARKPTRRRGRATSPTPSKKRRKRRSQKQPAVPPAGSGVEKKRNRVSKTPSHPGGVMGLLGQHVPTAVDYLASRGKEFTVADVHARLQTQGVTVERKHVSLYLGQRAGDLGLLVRKKLDPEIFPRPINFFRRAGAHPDPRSGGTDWSQRLRTVLQAFPEGLSEAVLLERAVEDIEPNFRAPRRNAARRRLQNLLAQGVVKQRGELLHL